ncbi:MAG: OmpA family protein [Bacteroidota bacterium]|nr:OmpA family protein [Bacteroidota bacterium]
MQVRNAAFFLFTAVAIAYAQDTPAARIGLHTGLNANLHNPNFPQNPAPTVPVYGTSATSITGALGLMGHIPLSTNLALGIRAAYTSLGNAELAASNVQDQRLLPSLPHLELLPTIGIRNLIISPAFWLWGGVEIGIPLSPTYSVDSAGITTSENAALPDPQTRIALAVGGAYDIPISSQWILQPELSVRFPFTKVSSNGAFDTWTIPQLRIGLNLFYSFQKEQQDTTLRAPAEPFVRARVARIISISPSGDTTPVRAVKVEDVQYTEYFPIVPYVFFPQNSDKPASKYSAIQLRETGETAPEDTLKDALSINSYILSLICRRMKQYPTARLTIIGTNDGRGELRNRSLSLQRAQTIRSELMQCGIDSTRLRVEARDLPEKPSAPNDPDGIVENRRVEFRATTPEILEPFQSRIGIERLATPDAVIFIPEVASSDPIKSWELTLTQAGRTLRTLRGEGTPRPITWSIRPSELSAQQVPIDYVFRAESVLGVSSESSGSIPVDYVSSTRRLQERAGNKTVDKFSLILFDFDSDVITPDNQRILDLKIVPSIKPGSLVKIYGYTDRIGDTRYNLDLSRRRAQSVMNYLRAKRPDARYETAGFGESVERFDNDDPTGRQLSRTVQIIIETVTQ